MKGTQKLHFIADAFRHPLFFTVSHVPPTPTSLRLPQIVAVTSELGRTWVGEQR